VRFKRAATCETTGGGPTADRLVAGKSARAPSLAPSFHPKRELLAHPLSPTDYRQRLKAFLLTKSDTLKTERDALKAEVNRLEKLTGKAAKPPAAGGGGDK